MPAATIPRTCTWELTDDMNGPRCGRPILNDQMWCNSPHIRADGKPYSFEDIDRMHQVARDNKLMCNFAVAYSQLHCGTTISVTNARDECPWLIPDGKGGLAPCQLEVEEGQLFCSRCDTKPDLVQFYPPSFITVMLQIARANQNRWSTIRKCAQMKERSSDDGPWWSMCNEHVKAGHLVCEQCELPQPPTTQDTLLKCIVHGLTATPTGQTFGEFMAQQEVELATLTVAQYDVLLTYLPHWPSRAYLRDSQLVIPL